MYPIITENPDKNLREDGKIEYSAFGVKLTALRNISDFLKSVGKSSFLTSDSMPILRKILEENNVDTIFSEPGKLGIFFVDDWIKEGICLTDNGYDYLYSFLKPKATCSPLYDEMVELSQSYFNRGKTPKTQIFLTAQLSSYLKIFKEIGFKIEKSTTARQLVGRSNILPDWRGTSIQGLKANTLALMLLTGETTYLEDGVEKQIFLDGVGVESVEWIDITKKGTSSRMFDSVYALKR